MLTLEGTAQYYVLRRSHTAFKWTLASGTMRAIGALAGIGAQALGGNIGLLAVIGNFKIILIAVFGALMLKEHKFIVHKLTTASMSVCGLMLTLRR